MVNLIILWLIIFSLFCIIISMLVIIKLEKKYRKQKGENYVLRLITRRLFDILFAGFLGLFFGFISLICYLKNKRN